MSVAGEQLTMSCSSSSSVHSSRLVCLTATSWPVGMCRAMFTRLRLLNALPVMQSVRLKWEGRFGCNFNSVQVLGWLMVWLKCMLWCSHPAQRVAGSGLAQPTALWCHRHLLALAECTQNHQSSAGTHTPTYMPQTQIMHLKAENMIQYIKQVKQTHTCGCEIILSVL